MMQALNGEPTLGHNPEVFKYWFKYERENQAFVFRGEFFDLFNIFAYWFPQMAEHPEYTSAKRLSLEQRRVRTPDITTAHILRGTWSEKWR